MNPDLDVKTRSVLGSNLLEKLDPDTTLFIIWIRSKHKDPDPQCEFINHNNHYLFLEKKPVFRQLDVLT